jgi:putative transposase
MAADLDATVEAFRIRPLDAGPYKFLAADALVLKVRKGGRVVNVHPARGRVNGDGQREVLGLQVTSSEAEAGWLAFFRDLTARGLSGSAWSPPTPTAAWSRRSARHCRERPGSAAARTTPRP